LTLPDLPNPPNLKCPSSGVHSNVTFGGDVILSYSDIAYNAKLLQKLIKEKKGDIIIAVDRNWEANYEDKRDFWHDKLNAELVFGNGTEISRIGEVVKSYNRDCLPTKVLWIRPFP